jgi:hypothetical protein
MLALHHFDLTHPSPSLLLQTHGKIGVIVATEPRGPLANLIYCPPDQPLFKVPRYLYDPVPSEGTGTLQCKCKQLAIGDQVEFGIDENRHNTVLWMMKSPDYLPIDCHSGGSPRVSDGTLTLICFVQHRFTAELPLLWFRWK